MDLYFKDGDSGIGEGDTVIGPNTLLHATIKEHF